MASRVFIRKLQPNLWQWRQANTEGQWLSDEFYTGDINLLKESVEGRDAWLIVPGAGVVSQLTDADIKDRRQLIKTLPFELEEDIVDPVEDLHFAFGNIENDKIPVIYSDVDELRESIAELEAIGVSVQRCLVDYLQLPIESGGWTLLLEGEWILAHTGRGLGFSVEIDTAPVYLAALSNGATPSALHLVADDAQRLEQLTQMLPDTLQSGALPVTRTEACFWDLIDPAAVPTMDFRSGPLARRLPLNKWWQTWKTPVIAVASAFVIAVGVTWLAQLQTEKERKRILSQTDEIYQQVASGRINNPERQLRAMLGGGGEGKPSNAVKLITAVAPAVSAFNDVVVRNFRYNADSAQLQMNIEAKSFDTFESLRARIAEKGYTVEIKSANVYNDVHQAQLRVTEAG